MARPRGDAGAVQPPPEVLHFFRWSSERHPAFSRASDRDTRLRTRRAGLQPVAFVVLLPVDIAGGEAETKVIKDRVVISAILVTFDVKCAGGLDFRVNERTELWQADCGQSIVGKPAFPSVSVADIALVT